MSLNPGIAPKKEQKQTNTKLLAELFKILKSKNLGKD
jgi:hypothetical protein